MFYFARWIKESVFPKTFYLTLGDAFMPFEGKTTRFQYITASRILDIENGGNDYKWQKLFTELDSTHPLTKDEDILLNKHFEKIINDLDCKGLEPMLFANHVYSKPVIATGNTHRVAWLYTRDKNAYLPIRIMLRPLIN